MYQEYSSDNEAVPSRGQDLESTEYSAARGHSESAVDAAPSIVGGGEHDEEEADGRVGLIGEKTRKMLKTMIRVRKTEER